MGNENKTCSSGSCNTGKCGKMMMPMMIIIALLVIGGIFIYSSSTKKDTISETNSTPTNEIVTQNIENNTNDNNIEKIEENTKNSNDIPTTNITESSYREYSPELLSATKKNILFFAATWCPNCQTADKNFSSSTIPVDINLLKVDYDTYSDLKQKYGIVMQHTFVEVDQNGNEIKKWSGSLNVDDLVNEI